MSSRQASILKGGRYVALLIDQSEKRNCPTHK